MARSGIALRRVWGLQAEPAVHGARQLRIKFPQQLREVGRGAPRGGSTDIAHHQAPGGQPRPSVPQYLGVDRCWLDYIAMPFTAFTISNRRWNDRLMRSAGCAIGADLQ